MRLSESLLAQRVEDRLVLVDRCSGAEIVLPPEERQLLLTAVTVLFRESMDRQWGVRHPDGYVEEYDNRGEAEHYADPTDRVVTRKVAVSPWIEQ